MGVAAITKTVEVREGRDLEARRALLTERFGDSSSSTTRGRSSPENSNAHLMQFDRCVE